MHGALHFIEGGTYRNIDDVLIDAASQQRARTHFVSQFFRGDRRAMQGTKGSWRARPDSRKQTSPFGASVADRHAEKPVRSR
jgi:hypothetical protein